MLFSRILVNETLKDRINLNVVFYDALRICYIPDNFNRIIFQQNIRMQSSLCVEALLIIPFDFTSVLHCGLYILGGEIGLLLLSLTNLSQQ